MHFYLVLVPTPLGVALFHGLQIDDRFMHAMKVKLSQYKIVSLRVNKYFYFLKVIHFMYVIVSSNNC